MVKTRRVQAKDGGTSKVAAARVLAVMKAAEHACLLDGKSTQISVRISLALVEQAKKRSGIQSDTQLIEFAFRHKTILQLVGDDRTDDAVDYLGSVGSGFAG